MGLLWACLLACGWGLVFALLLCSPFGVCAFGVCAFGVGALVGWWDSVVPPPLRAHCPLAVWVFGAHAPRVGAVGVCAVLRARWVEGGQVGAWADSVAP